MAKISDDYSEELNFLEDEESSEAELTLIKNLEQVGFDFCIAEGVVLNNMNYLWLQCKSLKNEQMALLSSALKANISVTIVDFGYNNIANRGIEFLVDMLRMNTTIKSISFVKTKISPIEIKAIVDMLKVNTTLIEIYLDQKNQDISKELAINKIIDSYSFKYFKYCIKCAGNLVELRRGECLILSEIATNALPRGLDKCMAIKVLDKALGPKLAYDVYDLMYNKMPTIDEGVCDRAIA